MRFEHSMGQIDTVEITWIGARQIDWARSLQMAQRDDLGERPFGVVAILSEVGGVRSNWLTRLAASDKRP
jgi:hypothetical protein